MTNGGRWLLSHVDEIDNHVRLGTIVCDSVCDLFHECSGCPFDGGDGYDCDGECRDRLDNWWREEEMIKLDETSTFSDTDNPFSQFLRDRFASWWDSFEREHGSTGFPVTVLCSGPADYNLLRLSSVMRELPDFDLFRERVFREWGLRAVRMRDDVWLALSESDLDRCVAFPASFSFGGLFVVRP